MWFVCVFQIKGRAIIWGCLVCMCIPYKKTKGYLRLFGLYVYFTWKDEGLFGVILFVCLFQIKGRGAIWVYLVCMCIPNKRTRGYFGLFGLYVYSK